MAIPSYEDDWEHDIHLDPTSTSIFSSGLSVNSGGIGVSVDPNGRGFHYSPDKELSIACERYELNAQLQQQRPFCYYNEDDCDSSIAGSSIFTSTASKFTEPSLLYSPILDDDFMYDEPLLPSKKYSQTVKQPTIAKKILMDQQSSSFPGIVQQLGTPAKLQEPKDNDDWTDDISISPRDQPSATPSFQQSHQPDILTFDLTKLSKKLYDIPKIFDVNFDDDDDDGLGDFDENDIGPSVSQRGSVVGLDNNRYAAETSNIAKGPNYLKARFEVEDDEDDNNMDGLDFPVNMAILASKIEEKKKYDPSKAQEQALPPPPLHAMTSKQTKPAATRIPISSAKAKILASIPRENDDDDFFKDLSLNDRAFEFNQNAATAPQRVQSNFRGNTKFVSRLARPTNMIDKNPLSTQQQLQKKRSLQQLPAVSSSTSRLSNRNLLAAQINKQREAVPSNNKRSAIPNSRRQQPTTTQTYSRNAIRPTIHPTSTINATRPSRSLTKTTPRKQQSHQHQHQTPSPSVIKTFNSYPTLIAQPKTKPTTGTYRTELDDLDNLPTVTPKKKPTAVWRPLSTPQKQQKQPQQANSSSNASTINCDPKRPWRTNMQTTKSKVKLFQPGQQNLSKEYNNMKFDERSRIWKGNEDSMFGFPPAEVNKRTQQKKPVAGLRLITMPRIVTNRSKTAAAGSKDIRNKGATASRYTAAMGHNMIFDAQSQKWVCALGEENEFNELDCIEDLYEEYKQPIHCFTGRRNGRNPLIHGDDKTIEFKIPVEMKREMMFQQEDHENFMKNWPLKEEEPNKIKTPSGHLVSASKYHLFYFNRTLL
ncbi:hypothetical protein BDF20DRAFT_831306 [Mycotypha africana]|uniref:uncharacterized protein n=1 Tax=Mycotypha africana TaxID=64632 RepID=UPI0023005580|nr:uncharacterized protein BDF20DRAFT_831306 [Mycotypha africana]KAI8991250.1 hypothetical protein BDF20DRAFT_831306 [Mycotypha africana]